MAVLKLPGTCDAAMTPGELRKDNFLHVYFYITTIWHSKNTFNNMCPLHKDWRIVSDLPTRDISALGALGSSTGLHVPTSVRLCMKFYKLAHGSRLQAPSSAPGKIGLGRTLISMYILHNTPLNHSVKPTQLELKALDTVFLHSSYRFIIKLHIQLSKLWNSSVTKGKYPHIMNEGG